MMPQCYIAIALAACALMVASYPHLRGFWERHTRSGRWHRRLAMVKSL